MTILDVFRLDGDVAIITGGGGGLGGAMARAFAEVGADVCVVGRSAATLDPVRRDIERRGRRALALSCDVIDPAAAVRIADEVADRLGGPTILVNNAGGLAGDELPLPALEMTEASWTAQIDLNLTSAWRLTKACAGHMANGGVVLNISSIKAFQPQNGSGAYAAAKAALNNLTLALSIDLAPRIRVNGIAPGPIPTAAFMRARGVTEADFPTIAEEWGVPPGSSGSPRRCRRRGPVPGLSRGELDHRPDADRGRRNVGATPTQAVRAPAAIGGSTNGLVPGSANTAPLAMRPSTSSAP